MATGNDYRKVRALLAKTVAAGCTEGEAVSSLETALKLIAKYDLDQSRLAITVPEGWAIKDGKVVKAEPTPKAERPKRTNAEAKPRRERKPKAPAEPKPKRPTRYDRVAEMLQRAEGVTIAQMMAEFGILPHTARAMISIGKRRAGLTVAYDKAAKVYRATAA